MASCLGVVDGPFAVINADDFYGRQAFTMICDFLKHAEDDDVYQYAMVGYELENTLTENGSVARGICEIDENGMLSGICERTRIEKRGDGAAFTEDGGPDLDSASEGLHGIHEYVGIYGESAW